MTKSNNNAIDPNVNLGGFLKATRESLDISLQQVHEDTRIQLAFLQALEENNYAKLPERTYALGYLKAYANYLQLSNANELVSILDNTYNFAVPVYSPVPTPLDDKFNKPASKKPKTIASTTEQSVATPDITEEIIKPAILMQTNTSSSKKQVNSGKYNIVAILFVAAFIALVLFVLYGFLYNKNNKLSSLVTKQETLDDVLKETTISDVVDGGAVYTKPLDEVKDIPQTSTTQNTTEKQTSNNSSNIPKTQSITTDIQVEEDLLFINFPATTNPSFAKLVFNDKVWIRIYKSSNYQEVYLDKIFEAGDDYNIPAVDDLAITIGNSKGLEFFVNNTKIDLTKISKGVVIRDLNINQQLLNKYKAN